jgi:hypothetical protein
MTGLNKAVVFRATEGTPFVFLKTPPPPGISAAAARINTNEFVSIECDCEGFFESGGAIFPCALAVAASKYAGSSPHINLNMLMESATI